MRLKSMNNKPNIPGEPKRCFVVRGLAILEYHARIMAPDHQRAEEAAQAIGQNLSFGCMTRFKATPHETIVQEVDVIPENA